MRSHTEEKIQTRPAGTKVFRLDTGNDGEDDVLLGASREDVLRDVLYHHEIKELPEHWELEELEEKEMANGNTIDFDAAVELMDDDLREEIHAALAPCTEQEFLDEYVKRHEKKFGEEFKV